MIEAHELTKRYAERTAVDGVSFTRTPGPRRGPSAYERGRRRCAPHRNSSRIPFLCSRRAWSSRSVRASSATVAERNHTTMVRWPSSWSADTDRHSTSAPNRSRCPVARMRPAVASVRAVNSGGCDATPASGPTPARSGSAPTRCAGGAGRCAASSRLTPLTVTIPSGTSQSLKALSRQVSARSPARRVVQVDPGVEGRRRIQARVRLHAHTSRSTSSPPSHPVTVTSSAPSSARTKASVAGHMAGLAGPEQPADREQHDHDDIAGAVQGTDASCTGAGRDGEVVDEPEDRREQAEDDPRADHVVAGAGEPVVVRDVPQHVEHDRGREQPDREDDQLLVDGVAQRLGGTLHHVPPRRRGPL